MTALLLVFGVAATVAATILGNGNVIVAVAPALVLSTLGVLWLVPLRVPLFTLTTLALILDATGEGPWTAPWAVLGDLIGPNLNKVIPVPALSIPGSAVLLLLLLAIYLWRVVGNAKTDGVAAWRHAEPIRFALIGSAAAVVIMTVWGVHRGGDVQMAKNQVQSFVYMLMMAYLTAVSLRSLGDIRLLGQIIVAAACVKAVIALYVIRVVNPPVGDESLSFATTHGDSLLFAVATMILLVRFAEAPAWRTAAPALLILPLLAGGMVANNRRLVWVEIAAAAGVFWVVSQRSRVKRRVVQILIAALPLFVVYVAVGWNAQSKIFAPIKTFRSVSDSDIDASTLYRDLENYNLFQTAKANPVGAGFGQPFLEVVKLPDISFFKEYRYMPHNSVLGLWAFCGPFGFWGLMLAPIVGVYLAARSYRYARVADERIAAMMALLGIVIYFVHCWGDIGFSERRGIYVLGASLAMAARMTVLTGAARTERHQEIAC
jgi:hypothetical protein